MLKKIVVFIFFLIFSVSTSFGQTIILGDSIKIKIKKIKIEKRRSVVINEAKNNAKSKKAKALYIYCQIESLNGKKVKIDAFSLIDDTYNLRFRILDYMGSKGKSWVGFGFQNMKYLKNKILDSNGKPYKSWLPAKYDPSKEDSFEMFTFENYKNIETPIFFGQNKNYKFSEVFKTKKYLSSVVYYSDSKFNTFLGKFYFPYNDDEKTNYKFYYGKALVAKIDL